MSNVKFVVRFSPIVLVCILSILSSFKTTSGPETSSSSSNTIKTSTTSNLTVSDDFHLNNVNWDGFKPHENTWFDYIQLKSSNKIEKRYRDRMDLAISITPQIKRPTNPIKLIKDFTLREQLTVFGIKNGSFDPTTPGYEFLVNSYLTFYIETGNPPKDMQQLFPNGINKDFLTRFVNSEDAQNKPGTLSYYFSPITGDLYDFNCSEFKKGQLYIAPITDTAFMEKELKSIQEKTGYPSTPELGKDIFYVYYRIYGEDQVIAENIIWGFNEKRCKNLADKYSKVG